jgi:hypothetical protein
VLVRKRSFFTADRTMLQRPCRGMVNSRPTSSDKTNDFGNIPFYHFSNSGTTGYAAGIVDDLHHRRQYPAAQNSHCFDWSVLQLTSCLPRSAQKHPWLVDRVDRDVRPSLARRFPPGVELLQQVKVPPRCGTTPHTCIEAATASGSLSPSGSSD